MIGRPGQSSSAGRVMDGTYEVAKHTYTKYIPELQHLVEARKNSADAENKVVGSAGDSQR